MLTESPADQARALPLQQRPSGVPQRQLQDEGSQRLRQAVPACALSPTPSCAQGGEGVGAACAVCERGEHGVHRVTPCRCSIIGCCSMLHTRSKGSDGGDASRVQVLQLSGVPIV